MPGPSEASILLVSPKGDDCRSLQRLLQDWVIDSTDSCREALAALSSSLVGVVVCSDRLRDGDWSDLLREVGSMDLPPPFIVLSDRADEHLWADVLRAGGYDLLASPLEPADALRTISHAAHRRACQRSERAPHMSRMAGVAS